MDVFAEHWVNAVCLADRVDQIVQLAVGHGCRRGGRMWAVGTASGNSGAISHGHVRWRGGEGRIHSQRHFIHLLEVSRVENMIGVRLL